MKFYKFSRKNQTTTLSLFISIGSHPPLTVLDKNGIRIIFYFAKVSPGVVSYVLLCAAMIVFYCVHSVQTINSRVRV